MLKIKSVVFNLSDLYVLTKYIKICKNIMKINTL